MDLVRRYAQELTRPELKAALLGSSRPVVELESTVELEPLREALSGLDEDLAGSEMDGVLVELIRPHLDLTRREAADMAVWHWLCVDQFPEVVAKRWKMGRYQDLPSNIPKSQADRFLGRSTLVGVARNTFARLWWAVENLGPEDASTVTKNQEDFVAVFERFYGLCGPAGSAAVGRFSRSSLGDVRQRDAATWLTQTIPTTVIEALNKEEVETILDESLEANS